MILRILLSYDFGWFWTSSGSLYELLERALQINSRFQETPILRASNNGATSPIAKFVQETGGIVVRVTVKQKGDCDKHKSCDEVNGHGAAR